MQVRWARSGFAALALLFVVATVIQVFLGGLAVMGGEDPDAHNLWGNTVMHIIPLLMIVLAFLGNMGRQPTGLSVVLLVIVGVQRLWLDDGDMKSVEAVHPTMALLIFGLGIDLMRRGFISLRAYAAEA